MFLFCTGLRILCRSCSNPSTSCCHCLIAIALVQTKTTSCLEHLNSHLTNWSPQSVLHTEATIRLWTINQVLSFMCSRGFSSQVKLHPNPWPWPTSPAGHDLASGSFLSYHFPLVFFLISTPSSLSSVLFFKHLSSFLPQDYSPYSPLCLAWHTPKISEWITLSLQCHLLREVYRLLPWTLCIS